jgi:hypothetical protein
MRRSRQFSVGFAAAIVLALPLAAQGPNTPRGNALVNQPQDANAIHPLRDYVPCTFAPADRDNFHALFNRGGKTAIEAARVAVNSSNLNPEQSAAAHQALDKLARQPAVTLSNIAPLLGEQLQEAAATNRGFTEQDQSAIGAVVKKTEEVAKYLEDLQTPKGIGCSNSVLTYDETRDIFGRRMANTYIAIQVTIRNLDPDHEFLLHDIQVAVDSDRFFATRDKQVAAGVAELGQMFNPRNQVMRYVEGAASALGTAAVPVESIDFSNAVHGLSAFVPVLKGMFPDFTVAQVTRLANLGFTAGSLTYVIPKSGSHSMVTFVPEKMFRIAVPKRGKKQPKTPAESEPAGNVGDEKYKEFKKFTPGELKKFQDSVELLVAGVHIQPVTPGKTPEATGFTCETPKGTDTTCQLTGKNLEMVKQVKLVFKSDSTEGKAISTKVEVDKADTAKAKVTFSKESIDTLKKDQAYTVVLVNQDDVDVTTTITFTPPKAPGTSSQSGGTPQPAQPPGTTAPAPSPAPSRQEPR